LASSFFHVFDCDKLAVSSGSSPVASLVLQSWLLLSLLAFSSQTQLLVLALFGPSFPFYTQTNLIAVFLDLCL